MTKLAKIFIFLFTLSINLYSFPISLVPDGEKELNINIDTETGAIINISEPVYSITASKYFKITPVGSNLDQRNTSLTDVSEFEIKVINKNKISPEKVTFVLSSKNAVNLNFIPKKTEDRYYQIKTTKKIYESNNRNNYTQSDIRYDFSNFLSTETKLIKAMLLDSDASFKRTIVNRDVDISPYSKTLSIKLVRVFQGANLFGYTFLFKNVSGKTIEIAPQHLAIGSPNRAIMAQSDHYKLTSCSENQNECVTAVRYIVRDSDYNFSDSSLQIPDPTMPFIISNQNKKGF